MVRLWYTPKMAVISLHWRSIVAFLGAVLLLFIYNEFLVYYVVLLQCSWPALDIEKADFTLPEGTTLKAMMLADTHLLGSKEGHWFDKLRREWQMERSFQTAMSLFSPEVVFVLGDLLDEGKWSNDVEFHDTVSRFQKMFRHSASTDLKVLVGNHDIGFHYMVEEHKRRRFASAFESPSVRMIRIKNNIFILLNSMAFEGDQCDMCKSAEDKLVKIKKQLSCSQGNYEDQFCRIPEDQFPYSRPIILQHFPMYRRSDKNCSGPDSAPFEEKYKVMREKWDTLSQEASEKLFQMVQPRLVISGHTHNFCYHEHKDGTQEWTLPSFNWRNKRNPSFLLAVISSNNFSLKKCYLPNEQTVIYTYIVGGIFIFIWFIVLPRVRGFYTYDYRPTKRH